MRPATAVPHVCVLPSSVRASPAQLTAAVWPPPSALLHRARLLSLRRPALRPCVWCCRRLRFRWYARPPIARPRCALRPRAWRRPRQCVCALSLAVASTACHATSTAACFLHPPRRSGCCGSWFHVTSSVWVFRGPARPLSSSLWLSWLHRAVPAPGPARLSLSDTAVAPGFRHGYEPKE